jgi:hypothetical protein
MNGFARSWYVPPSDNEAYFFVSHFKAPFVLLIKQALSLPLNVPIFDCADDMAFIRATKLNLDFIPAT